MTLTEDSTQIEYRDFIIEHVAKCTKDMSSETLERWQNIRRHWNLLRYLEKSFETEGVFKQNKAFGLGKERIIVNESEIKALTIEKIMKYTDVWKSRIATVLFFSTFGEYFTSLICVSKQKFINDEYPMQFLALYLCLHK